MPTPAILSSQMEPPPVKPVVEMNFVTGEYEVFQEPVEMDYLIRNASGPDSEIAPLPGKGIFLHNDDNRGFENIFPPSIVGTPELIALVQSLLSDGGLTTVCEFENDYIWNADDDIPLVYVFGMDPFSDYADYIAIEWPCLSVSTTPRGYMSEGYSYGHPTISQNYRAGSPNAAGSYRRHRFAGTFSFDRGGGVGVNRYQSGQSVDGSPQNVTVNFGRTPHDTNYNLSYFPTIHSIHFMGVGVNTDTQQGIDDGWWWWPPPGVYWRYFAFYQARPVGVLPILSKQEHLNARLSQIYAEVIHDKVV